MGKLQAGHANPWGLNVGKMYLDSLPHNMRQGATSCRSPRSCSRRCRDTGARANHVLDTRKFDICDCSSLATLLPVPGTLLPDTPDGLGANGMPFSPNRQTCRYDLKYLHIALPESLARRP